MDYPVWTDDAPGGKGDWWDGVVWNPGIGRSILFRGKYIPASQWAGPAGARSVRYFDNVGATKLPTAALFPLTADLSFRIRVIDKASGAVVRSVTVQIKMNYKDEKVKGGGKFVL
jgi:hypothetical protein